jgi:hypothetical protein
VDRIDFFNGLEFYDQASFDQEIQPMDADLPFSVKYTDRKLTIEGNSPRRQFNTECFFVEYFQETRAK